MKIKQKREAGYILGRAALAQKVINLGVMLASTKCSYKDAMKIAGKISVIAQAATFDEYWNEKTYIGITDEEFDFERVIDKSITRSEYITGKTTSTK